MSLIEEALRRVKDPLVPPASSAPATPAQKLRQTPVSPATPAAHSWSPLPASSTSRTPHTPSVAPLTMAALAVLALPAALIVGGAVWFTQGSRKSVSVEQPASESVDSKDRKSTRLNSSHSS